MYFQCIADTQILQHIRPHDLSHHHHHEHDDNDDASQTNSSSQSNHHHSNNLNISYSLTKEDVLNICPVLLYQLSTSTDSDSKNGCIFNSVLDEIETREENEEKSKEDILYG